MYSCRWTDGSKLEAIAWSGEVRGGPQMVYETCGESELFNNGLARILYLVSVVASSCQPTKESLGFSGQDITIFERCFWRRFFVFRLWSQLCNWFRKCRLSKLSWSIGCLLHSIVFAGGNLVSWTSKRQVVPLDYVQSQNKKL